MLFWTITPWWQHLLKHFMVPTLFAVVSGEAGLAHTLTRDRVTAHGVLLALAFIGASFAPVTGLTSYEDSNMLIICSVSSTTL